jgi:hypothetical protein
LKQRNKVGLGNGDWVGWKGSCTWGLACNIRFHHYTGPSRL